MHQERHQTAQDLCEHFSVMGQVYDLLGLHVGALEESAKAVLKR